MEWLFTLAVIFILGLGIAVLIAVELCAAADEINEHRGD